MATPRKSAQKKKTPTSQRKQKNEAGPPREFFDPKMEFDAPMYHNFSAQTPENERVDDWFEARLLQMQQRKFVEPIYSPLTLQKSKDHSRRQKTRTPSTRKAKKVMGIAPELSDDAIPKMSLEDADDVPRSTAPLPRRVPSNSSSKSGGAEVKVSQQPAVPASAVEKLAAIPDMKPFVVAQPVPLSVVSSQANDNTETKVEGGSVFQSIQGGPPIRKRRLWAKPGMDAAKPQVSSPEKVESQPPTTVAQLKTEEVSVATMQSSLKPSTASLASKTPVASRTLPSRTLASKTPSAAAKPPSKTPVAAPKAAARTPLEKPVVKKTVLTVPVSPRCYHSRNTRSQAQLVTRSQTMQIKPNGRTLTRPKEFSFMSRGQPIKKQKTEFVSEKVKELTVFPSLLRSESDAAPRQPHGLTKPVEFHFATTTRARSYARQHPANLDLAPQAQPVTRGLTQPKEFNFATSRRARATITPAILQPKPRPTYGVSKTTGLVGKHLTVPQAFNLSKSNRPKREAEAPLAETKPKYKPAGKPVVGRAPPRKRELTVPVTPQVVARKRKSIGKVVEEAVVFKARPAPQAAPFIPADVSRSLTITEPFELLTDIRGVEKVERLKHQVEEEIQREQDARLFVARPVPPLDASDGIPVVEPAPLTVFEPFNLQSEALTLIAKQKLEERILYEKALEEEMRKFKANPPLSLKRAPFRPLTSNRPLTVPETPDLKSTLRAQDRADFSVEKNQRISLKEEREMQEQALEEENEREEIRKLRKTLVFKATPFVNPSPMRLAPNTRPRTVPESPQLRTTLRGMR